MGTVLIWIVAVLLTLVVVALAGVLFQVVRQQGALLLRLEALEASTAGNALPTDGAQLGGVPAGTRLEPFKLPDATGRMLGLEDVPGRRLLVHWNPGCGFCGQIADELGRLEPAVRRHGTRLVLVSWGDVESNRRFAQEHGLGSVLTLLQDGSRPLPAFAGLGTPVAYLVDAADAVERLAVGAPDVLGLAREVAAGRPPRTFGRPVSLTESRVERGGLKAGTQAPSFTLPDVTGAPVALDSYRGRPLLLVFSDPGCGPCNALAPELAARARAQSAEGLQVLVVSRGDVEENRRKAEALDLPFVTVLQEGWRLSRRYGIFETPVAFLIDRDGVIARDVARGRDEILALVDDAHRAGEEAPATDVLTRV